MYIFKRNILAKEHDKFVKSHELGNLLQSSSWAKIKDNWVHELVGVYNEEKLVASALVLLRPLPLGFKLLYTPRGPIMDYNNKELVRFFMKELKKLGRKHNAVFAKIDPTIHYRDFHLHEEQKINPNAALKIAQIEDAGATWQGLSQDMHDTIQPRFQANVYQEEFSEEILSKKTRQMLRTARNKGVQTKIGGLELLEEFVRLMQLTEERKEVKLRSGGAGNYYKKLLETYSDDSFIMLAQLNLKELFEATQKRFDENEAQLAKLKENQVKKRHNLEELRTSLTREVNELSKKLEENGEIVTIAGTLSIVFGKTSEILYAGLDDNYKRYMPAYLTWFETIQETFNRGALSSNMGGLENSLNDGLLQFKNNFNPRIEEFVGEFNLPINPLLYKVSEVAYNIKKRK
ncbi:MAG: aminoacyltransferase [Streptococcaceae bacterium]|nr:aminoacyltransferase [Streptococcaceae bacterium]